MNLTYRASAGTGKTHRLTQLYVSLVLGERLGADIPAPPAPVPPQNIVAVTFTENAAAELRVRVASMLLGRRETDERVQPLIENALRRLPSAHICTIHSFCARLLREHAVERGWTPAFTVLDEEAAWELITAAAERVLRARLNPASAEHDPQLKKLCDGMRVRAERARSVLQGAIGWIHEAATFGVRLDRDPAAVSEPTDPDSCKRDFLDALGRLQGLAAEGQQLPKKASDALERLNAALKGWRSGTRSMIEDLALFRQQGVFSFRGKDVEEIARAMRESTDRWLEAKAYREHRPALEAFVRYAQAVAREYARLKRERQALDFDDLQIEALSLLEERPELCAPFQYILLDEAQDSSRLQCEILRKLWRVPDHYLILCGDRKQSIYTWRDADPRVMEELTLEQSERGAAGSFTLRQSFRSKDLLLEAVNEMAADLYGESYRTEESLLPSDNLHARTGPAGEGPCVELLMPAPRDTLPTREERARSEMEAVACRIRLLIANHPHWTPRFRYCEATRRFEPVSESNRFAFRDVLILMRSTTRQPLLEQALHRYGIPYRVAGRGRGLFSRSEAMDLYLLLQFLTRAPDALTWWGLLRSPWVAVSDETLLALGWQSGEFSSTRFMDAALGRAAFPSTVPEEERQRIARARDLWRAYAGLTDTLRLSEIVRRIVQQTGYDAVLAAGFRGEQRLANWDKLMGWLAQAEKTRTASQVAFELERRIQQPPDEPEAPLFDPQQNMVTIMTIHAAKGLTAHVVVLPETSSTPAMSWPWVMSRRLKDKLILEAEMETLEGQRVRSTGYAEALAERKSLRESESKNLLYVALTRARDLVIASGDPGGRTSSERWFEILHKHAEANPRLFKMRTFEETRAAANEIGIAPLAAGGSSTPLALKAQAALREPARYARSPELPSLRLRYPATLLAAWIAGSRDLREARSDDESVDDDRATLLGAAGHKLLEWLAKDRWAIGLLGKDVMRAVAPDLTPEEHDDVIARVTRACLLLRAECEPWKTEWPFALRLSSPRGPILIDGTADLVCRNNTKPLVVDYKFTSELTSQARDRYGIQLNIYRLAVARCLEIPADHVQTRLLVVKPTDAEWVEVPYDPQTEPRVISAAWDMFDHYRVGA